MESTCNKYIMLINYFCHSVMRPFHALEISGMIRSWGGYQCYCTRYLLGVLYEGKFISNDISRYIHGGLTCMLEGSDHWPPSSRPQDNIDTTSHGPREQARTILIIHPVSQSGLWSLKTWSFESMSSCYTCGCQTCGQKISKYDILQF